jgi:natural product biosynthesis luciferase-like monooxygenase protein
MFSCILIGNDTLTQHCGAKLLAAGHNVVAVFTRATGVADWARDNGLPVQPLTRDAAQQLAGQPFDWLLSVANLDIIPDDLLALPKRGAVNFHDGPLPRHAGLNAPVWALIEGEKQHGITWHFIEGGIDEGDIIVARNVAVSASDTALSLNTSCFAAAMESFDEVMEELSSDAPRRVKQNLALRSYHALADRPASNGWLDLSHPAAELERLVRALDHGEYWNPLCVPKLRMGGTFYTVGSVAVVDGRGDAGQVLSASADTLTVACGSDALRISGLRCLDGATIQPESVAKAGDTLDAFEDIDLSDIAKNDAYWRRALAKAPFARVPGLLPDTGRTQTLILNDVNDPMAAVGRLVVTLGGGLVAFQHSDIPTGQGLLSPWLPVQIADDFNDQKQALSQRKTFALDLMLRDPALADMGLPDIAVSDNAGAVAGIPLTIEMSGDKTVLHYDSGRIPELYANAIAARLQAENDALTEIERDLVLNGWNDTITDFTDQPMHRLFEAQVAKTPEATALVFEDQSLTYADLNAAANRLARVLVDMGVEADTVVGLCCRRSFDLMVGALAILKAGGAYLPMDPTYPADRLRHFVSDSGAKVVLTQSDLLAQLPEHDAEVLAIDTDPRATQQDETNLGDTSGPEDLAYLIYTSGSTGLPKGVMIEHRNVANFYCGMDAVVPDHGGTWLAVTSLSFDISVLELFYTTARGFRVVIASDEDRAMISGGALGNDGGMEFSLYYWGNDDGRTHHKYDLLLEGAKFGDEHGFCAVWTPERHFHAFGGPYPNPSVTGAAVAAVTKNIGVRAGSCVAPLHHPARIAEEWAVIDNLTDGRAGLAIASGWQPDDFVLRPENTPPNNKPAMFETIDILRKLWAGEPVPFQRKDGTMHEVVTQPRPVSAKLPVWVTTAGNPETWREAGTIGANVLTHLLGQSVDEVADKIKLYHQALKDAGHDPKDHKVTLMLHTFLAETREEAQEIAREPMKDYLRSAAGLIKQYAWAFPAFKKPEGAKNAFDLDLGSLEQDELEGILDFAFERYFNDSGLFGTVDDAMDRVRDLQKIGVTEVACLIDYGIPTDTVLAGLRPLAKVVAQSKTVSGPAADDFSLAAQIVRHDVTHLQCTPSMMRMISMNDEARFALSRVKHLFLGGEALPGALVSDLGKATDATVTNMYGPTETTIWSSTQAAGGTEAVVNVGLPIANTQLYVLDDAQNPVGIGAEGELWIGGTGVTRGYWNRAELTAERFVENPFHGGRMYRTGDLVRRRGDGRIEFIGRVDHQVKLRGFRIELGEIEARLEAVKGVRQAVVMAREDQPGDLRLVGYYTGSEQAENVLNSKLSEDLPSFMVPSRFVNLSAFPLTPNKKVDRGALPAPEQKRKAPAKPASRPAPVSAKGQGDTVRITAQIAAIWSEILGVDQIDPRDSFFDLGGHSLLAVQAHRAIRDGLKVPKLAITDIFRAPTLSALAARVAELSPTTAPEPATQDAPAENDRAQSRRDAMARRREMRARRKV